MIYLLCSTIRPKVFKTTHKTWMEKADNPQRIKTKVIVDTFLDYKELETYDVEIYEQENKGITNPLTRLTQSLIGLNDNDIIIVMSDDFFPPHHWDTFVSNCYKDYSGGLSVYDGGSPEIQKTIITLPIMDYETLKLLNKIVYHPAYTHMYSDNELYNNLVELDRLKIIDPKLGFTFEHKHWTRGSRARDKQDEELSAISLNSDKYIFEARQKLTLKERLEYTPMVKPLLSILICTIPNRSQLLKRLMDILTPQLTPLVEVLVESDTGEMPIGAKRNKLLSRATGMYIAFIDDDDMVSDKYVDLILKSANYKWDCIGIEGIITTNGLNPKRFIHSIKNKSWCEKDGVYLRSPNHCNPVKRSIALEVGFDKNKSFQEDKDYSERLLPLLKSEVYINIPLYGYMYAEIKKGYR